MARRRRTDFQPTIWAAGAVVYRMRNNKPEFLLVHRPRYDDWSLPKGKLDRGERFAECAEREVAEECGAIGNLHRHLGTVGYRTGAGNYKAIRYWMLEAEKQKFKPGSEVDRVRWFRYKKAERKATYTRDGELLRAAMGLVKGRKEGRVFLVRHAHAGDKRKWKRADAVRPISPKGHEQVEDLTSRLLRTPLNAIISSPFLRCEQTVHTLGIRLGLDIKKSKKLLREATPDDVLALIAKYKSRRVVLCTHGETIGPLIERLAADPDVDLKGPIEWPKGSTWVLTTKRGKVTAARFVPGA